MRKIPFLTIITLLIAALITACAPQSNGFSPQYATLIDSAYIKAGPHANALKALMANTPKEQKEGMAFLIAFMPECDLVNIDTAMLAENVHYAYKARTTFEWCKNLPDSIFMNEVLPYACLNEQREAWRKGFYERFSPYVANCKDIYEAIDSINKNIRNEVLVDYNTKRRRPDQSPSESIELGMASCSGLSILLTDALRAVGIPSRVAGTPNWHDKRGNHNWSEVWANGQWYFTEYYPERLNQSWFLADAGKANKEDLETAIYAASYRPTGIYFPLVWNKSIRYVHAENVTDRYINIYQQHLASIEEGGNHIEVKIRMLKNRVCTLTSDTRVATLVDVFCGTDQIGGGTTAGPTQDMNDILSFKLEKNKTYTFKYMGNKTPQSISVEIGDAPSEVKLYMEE